MPIASVNPATGETQRRFDPLDDQALEERLACAAAAFAQHRRTTFAQRSTALVWVAKLLETEEESFASIITFEMGKPIGAAREEIAKCAAGCRFYAVNAQDFLAPQEMLAATGRRYVRFDPIGPVLAIMPWNFPFWQVIRFAAPALMAGNVCLLKHAANVPQCALALEEIFRRAGFTEHAFQTLLIENDATAAVIDDPRVRAVTLTGSERAGAEVASRAARQIKKSVLELGGSDPFIVMPSADLEQAVATGVKSRTMNSGQSCIAAKRFIIAEAIYGRYVEQFVAKMHALKLGDPLDESTDLGPLATEEIREGVHEQVQKTIEAGAKLLLGGRKIEAPGFFYTPTVLVDVPLDSPAAREEIFGPVAAFFRVRDVEEAIARANDTPFGLGANAWTTDAAEQDRFATELEAGLVFINGMVASAPDLPFGGVKRSGFGRELGAEGIREFVNVKTVVVGS
ncbi:MAG: NAD-dependent succinate-semialdehyde dehydrogenase [Chthoniobacterales bacterium]